MARPRRLLVLALDAASPERVRAWAADGTMPHVAELLATGRSAPTRSVDGLFVGATWPSFFMGRGPGEHGLYWLDRILPGTYRVQQGGASELGRYEALWEVLAAAGRRTCVLDVPLAPLSSRSQGPQVVEWGVHDAVFGFETRPAAMASKLLDRFGAHPAPRRCAARRTPAEARAFANQLVEGAALRARMTRALLADPDSWDFAIQVFSETHCAGHQLWHYHDPAHPAHDPAVSRETGDLVAEVYRAVDAAVGDIIDAAPPGTTVALMVLHGMGPAGGGSLLLPEILRRLGVETPAPVTGGESAPSLLRRLYHRLPVALRGPLHRLRQRGNQKIGRGSPLDLDPAATRAFHVGLGLGAPFSGIRLNLRGREPAGTLEPGAEVEAFVADLRREILALVDPRTRRPLALEVHRSRDLFDGPHLDELPDLLVEWDLSAPRGTTAAGEGREAVWEAESERLGRISATNRYCRTGEHRPEGLVVVAGDAIRPARLEGPLSVVDLAPTFAAWMGCETPTMTGSNVAELFGDDEGLVTEEPDGAAGGPPR